MRRRIYIKSVLIFLIVSFFGAILFLKKINLGLDLKGGMYVVLALEKEKLTKDVTLDDALRMALEILRTRIDALGIAEATTQAQGKDKIIIEVPGVKDPERVKKLIGKTALLEFRLVDDERLADALKDKPPAGYEILYSLDSQRGERIPFLVKKEPELTGKYLVNAWVYLGQGGGLLRDMPLVGLKFNDEGAKIFKRVTEMYLERRLAIVLDNVVKSAPTIRAIIPDGEAVIENIGSIEEANDLAIVLKAGALPCPLKMEEDRIIGPTLGKDTIKAGIFAICIGMALVFLFMSIYYKLAGLIASIGLLSNLIIVLGTLSLLEGTLTLPGIAGLVLTVGISVDANVLIFERIREELTHGKTPKSAIDVGYSKAFSTILDSHLTLILTALILFLIGTGPIRGFALTLGLGMLTSFFSALILTKTFFEAKREYKTLSI